MAIYAAYAASHLVKPIYKYQLFGKRLSGHRNEDYKRGVDLEV